MSGIKKPNRPSEDEIADAYGTMLMGRSTYLRVDGWEPQETKYMNRPWKRAKEKKS